MAGYIGSRAAVATSGVERKKTFAITTTTTSLTGLDYTPNHVHVFHNGIRLVDGTDYTATNGTSITLVNAAENGDEVVVVSYGTFSPADTYTKTEADDRYVNASGDTMTGGLIVSAADTNDIIKLSRTGTSAGSGYIYSNQNETFGVHNGAGAYQLMVDSAGRVTMPYQPHFVVKANYGSHTVLNDASPDWSLVYRNNGGHFNTSTDTFTVPVTGLYFFRTHALIDKSANSGYNYAYAQFYFNGSSYNDIGHTPSNGTTSYIDVALTVVVYLQAGDTAQARYTTVNGAAFYAGSTYNSFTGYLIG